MPIRCEFVSLLDRPARFDRPVAILIPAYDEAEHIGDVVRRAWVLGPASVTVIDDASKDGTAAVARAAGARVLRNDVNLGKQGSVRRGLAALEGPEPVALIDGDGQHDPADLPALVALLDDYDLVLGARSQDEMPKRRRLSNALVNVGFYAIGGVDFIDVQSGLRVFSRPIAALLAAELPSAGGYALEHVSLSLIARRADARAAAAPISCRYGPASKMRTSDVIGLAVETVRHAWRIRRAA